MDESRGSSTTLEALAATVAELEERVARLEQAQRGPAAAPVVPVLPVIQDAGPAAPETSGPRLLDVTLIGRSLIVLGCGFLLRALTDLPAVPDEVGAAAGLSLAALLVLLADRAAARGAGASGLFHAATALAIADPLVGELVGRFRLIGPTAAAALVLVYGAALLAVAWRRRLAGLAWLGVGATVVALPLLAVQTRTLHPFVVASMALAAGAALAGRALGQRGLAWAPVVLADLLVALLMPRALWGESAIGPWTAVATGLGFFLLCAGGALARALHDRAATTFPEGLQAGAAYLVGFLPAAGLAARLPGGPVLGALLVAAGGLTAHGALRRFAARPDLAFWTSLGLAIVLGALNLLVSGPLLGLAALGPALALLHAARRRASDAAELQALAALLVAAAATGLLSVAAAGLVGDAAAAAGPTWAGWIVLVALACVPLLGLRERPADAPLLRRAAPTLALVLAAFCVAGVIAGLAVALPGATPATAATIRTGLLAALAVGLALAARTARLRTAGALVYPVLGLTAAKVALEDLRVGGAAALFVSLALLGLALIAAQRLKGRG